LIAWQALMSFVADVALVLSPVGYMSRFRHLHSATDSRPTMEFCATTWAVLDFDYMGHINFA